MTFTSITFPAQGGPEHGKGIEGKGMKCADGHIAWPAGMWTRAGSFYELMFDENDQPTHFRYEPSRDREPAPTEPTPA